MTDIKSKGFILYEEDEELFDELDGEETKALIKACFAYHNRGEDLTDTMNGFVRRAFKLIKRNMIRDAEKYLEAVIRNRENGQKGGRPKNPVVLEENPKNPVGFSENPKNPVGFSENPKNPTKTKTKTKTKARAEAQTEARAETKEYKDPADPSPDGERRVPASAEPLRMTKAEAEQYYAELYQKKFVRDQMMAIDVEKGYVVITDANS